MKGFQGDEVGAPDRILACPKHLAGYGAARGGRDYEDAEVSDSELWNVYLPPFRAAVEAGAATVMSAYMDLNGVPASANRWLLTDVLRQELGFQGFSVSDANAVRSLTTQRFAQDQTDAAVRALSAGLDMEMTQVEPAFANLAHAVRDGLVDGSRLDESVRRVLEAKVRLGLFDDPYVDVEGSNTVLGTAEHRAVAREAAERSCVLLTNDGLLPLDGSSRSIAVLGPLANEPRDTLGPWVFAHEIGATTTILAGIRDRAGDAVRVDHAPGVVLPPRLVPSPFDQLDRSKAAPAPVDEDAELARAVSLAAGSEVAIVVVGQPQNASGESASTSTLDLPGRQLELLQAVHATGTPTVVVVMAGRPVDLTWAHEHLAAILQVWHPGTDGGSAVARILFGDVSPAGRLPFTWPRDVGQVPLIYSHLTTFAPDDEGRRYWNTPSVPLYRFGHGLSYASFTYEGLRVSRDTFTVGESTTVSVDVTNTSDRLADEVVQLYVHQRYGTSSRPVRELKGFRRITLAPHETRVVEFELGPDELRYWSATARGWVQDATQVDIWVGGSSCADVTTHVLILPSTVEFATKGTQS